MKTPPTATNGKPDKPGGCPRTATSVGPLGAAVERRPGWPMMPMIQCFTEASATASATSETKKTRRICGSKMGVERCSAHFECFFLVLDMIFGYKMIQMIFWDGFARLRCGGGSVDSVHFGLMVLTRISMATSFILMASWQYKKRHRGWNSVASSPWFTAWCVKFSIWNLWKVGECRRMLDRSSSWRSVIWWSPRPWRKWPPSSWRTSRASPNPVTWTIWIGIVAIKGCLKL